MTFRFLQFSAAGVVLAALPARRAAGQLPASGARLRHFTSCRWHPECSTAPGHLEVTEAGREIRESGTVVSYRLAAAGFPPHLRLDLRLWGGEQPARITSGYVTDAEGRVTCPSRIARSPAARHACVSLDSLTVKVDPLYAGFAVQFALISADDSVRVYARAVPFPIFATDGSCRVEVEMTSRLEARITGSGFEPTEQVQGISEANSQVTRDTLSADAEGATPGRGRMLILTFSDAGTTGGHATYTMVGGHCRPSVDFLWGDQLKTE
jgi:hypothetical protein